MATFEREIRRRNGVEEDEGMDWDDAMDKGVTDSAWEQVTRG